MMQAANLRTHFQQTILSLPESRYIGASCSLHWIPVNELEESRQLIFS